MKNLPAKTVLKNCREVICFKEKLVVSVPDRHCCVLMNFRQNFRQSSLRGHCCHQSSWREKILQENYCRLSFWRVCSRFSRENFAEPERFLQALAAVPEVNRWAVLFLASKAVPAAD